MIERRIGTEELPPLPDDLDAASEAKRSAEARLSSAKSSAPETFGLVSILRDMRVNNGFGPRLEYAYQLRSIPS